jgi:putative ABC transport system permease protein
MPDWTALVRERLAALSQQPPDAVVVEELAVHLSQAYDEARESGLSRDDARAAALRVLDASDLLRRTLDARRPALPHRIDQWTRHEPAETSKGLTMASLNPSRDVRYALRMLLRAPAFSLIAILTFAVGIGINTAVFNVVNGVLLRPLPYPDPDQITMVWVHNRRQNLTEDITSYPNFVDWKTQSTSYAHMAGFTESAFTLTGDGEPERLRGASVTASFFDVMQIAPAMGRVFTAANETPGQDTVIVISHGFWRRRFGGARDVLGRTIVLSGRTYEVIGVMPPALRLPDKAELWRPLAPAQQLRDSRNSFWLPVIGRLKPGVSVERAQSEMKQIGDRLEEAFPANRGYGINVVPLYRQLVGNIERPLLVLFAAVGFVLLIACANLANLMLGRTAARRKELAIRTALGAGRGRLVRQIVTETFVLALLGGVAGVLLAYLATGFFVTLGGDSIPRPDAIVMDVRVLGFALLLATVSALLSGLVPAFQASRRKVVDHLREGARQGGSVASRRTRNALVAAEVGLALVLLTGAGLLIRTLLTMQHVERGFRPENVAMMTVGAPASAYREPADVRGFYARLLERVRALPGVEEAATGTGVLQPLVANSSVFSIEGKPDPPPEQMEEYPVESVSSGYFKTLGMTLALGRDFNDGDHADAPRAVVINETLARKGWPGQDPIGRRMKYLGDDSQAPWMTVVGVITDAHRADVTREIRPEVYFCAQQGTPRTQTLFVRTSGDPNAIVPAVRRELQAIDPQVAMFNVTSLESEISRTLSQPRFQAVLLAGFAGIALLLATIGIYGVTSHAVTQRTQEVGIRMAMGAARRDVLLLLIAQHLRPALAGLALGLAGALVLSRFIQTLLFGVGAADPLTFTLVGTVLLLVAAGACWIPARRATRIDPLVALRGE